MIDREKYVQTEVDVKFADLIDLLIQDDPELEKLATSLLDGEQPANNQNITIKFKKLHADVLMPKQGTPTDAGYDIVAVDDGTWDKDGRYIEYKTGLAVALPSGYHLKVAPRSSNSKYDLLLCNSEGLIDNAYRGEIRLRFKYVMPSIITENKEYNLNHDKDSFWPHKYSYNFMKDPSDLRIYKKGDRIAQLKIEKTIYADFEEVAELDQTDRNEGGFGSTGV